MPYALIFIGGGLGSLLRFALSSLTGKAMGTDFPWGTLVVNLLGAFVIGMVVETLNLKGLGNENLRLLLVTGFLGGFTTFSAFSLETTLMLTRGDYFMAVLYIGASVFGTVALVLGAMQLCRVFIPA